MTTALILSPLIAIAGYAGYRIGHERGLNTEHRDAWNEVIARCRSIVNHVGTLDGGETNFKYKKGKKFATSTIIDELNKMTYD